MRHVSSPFSVLIFSFLSLLFHSEGSFDSLLISQHHSVDVGPSGKGTSLSKNRSVIITGDSSTQLRNKERKTSSTSLNYSLDIWNCTKAITQHCSAFTDDWFHFTGLYCFLLLIMFFPFPVFSSLCLPSMAAAVTSLTPHRSIIYISADEPQTVKRSFRRPWSQAGLFCFYRWDFSNMIHHVVFWSSSRSRSIAGCHSINTSSRAGSVSH